jgi:hypothetical protein
MVAVGLSAVLTTLPLAAMSPACEEATARYRSAVSAITEATRRYEDCVASSAGNDDCAFEFRRLASAQGEFAVAIARLKDACL